MHLPAFIKHQITQTHLKSFELSSSSPTTTTQKASLIAQKILLVINAAILDLVSTLALRVSKFRKSQEGSSDFTFIFKKVFDNLFKPSLETKECSIKHRSLKDAISSAINQHKSLDQPIEFTEKQLSIALSASYLDFPNFLINGAGIQEKLAALGANFRTRHNIFDLQISHQTAVDLPRTPVVLTQKSGRIHELGILNTKMSLDFQVKELKSRMLQSLGHSEANSKIVEIAINCIHQEQIKPLHFYVQNFLSPKIHLQAKKTGRVFAISINHDNTISIKETILLSTLREDKAHSSHAKCGDLETLDVEFDISYSYKITTEGSIQDTTFKAGIKTA